jgi:hypothetical protein
VLLGESLCGLGYGVKHAGKLDLSRSGKLGVNSHVFLAQRTRAEH